MSKSFLFFLFFGTFIHLRGLLGQCLDLDLDQGLKIYVCIYFKINNFC